MAHAIGGLRDIDAAVIIRGHGRNALDLGAGAGSAIAGVALGAVTGYGSDDAAGVDLLHTPDAAEKDVARGVDGNRIGLLNWGLGGDSPISRRGFILGDVSVPG